MLAATFPLFHPATAVKPLDVERSFEFEIDNEYSDALALAAVNDDPLQPPDGHGQRRRQAQPEARSGFLYARQPAPKAVAKAAALRRVAITR